MKSNQIIAKFVKVLDSLDLKGIHIPGLIMSSPGAGKTSSIELYSKIMDYNLISLIASQYSADDILGLQSVQDGELKRLTPSWFNNLINISKNGKRTILFIDEITTCDEFIQSPLLNLIFNRSLGERVLPDNVFLLAAGNYSEELNGAFSMTAPLVNRFLLLNIQDADYSISEVMQRTFRNLDPGSYSSYLDLYYTTSPKYNFNKFQTWMERNIRFTPSNIVNNREEGLLGFCSIRSLSYCMDYAQEYMSLFTDNEWIRVVGDTLGKFKSGDDWLPLRNKLTSNLNTFLMDKVEKPKSFTDILYDYVLKYKDYLDSKILEEPDHSELESLLDPERLTTSETRAFTKAYNEHKDYPVLKSLYEKFFNEVDEGLNFN